VRLTQAEYEAVRTDPRRFLVAPGNVSDPEIERVVEKDERYWVVEKVGAAGRVAEEAAEPD
jgi:hypothetical protein